MAPLDHGAARALERMLSGNVTDWPASERSDWVRFIVAFFFRNPESVALVRNHILELYDATMEDLRDNYENVRKPGDPETFEEVTISDAIRHFDASNFLAEIIDNDKLGPTIFDMHWAMLDMKRSKFSIMTSDRPIVMPLTLGNPHAYIVLPITPTKLFVAVRQRSMVQRLNQVDRTALVREVNMTVVRNAREFVWAQDDSQLEFVRKHIAKSPERQILTQEQMKAALDAARGLTNGDDAD
jgi:hypothetical protein